MIVNPLLNTLSFEQLLRVTYTIVDVTVVAHLPTLVNRAFLCSNPTDCSSDYILCWDDEFVESVGVDDDGFLCETSVGACNLKRLELHFLLLSCLKLALFSSALDTLITPVHLSGEVVTVESCLTHDFCKRVSGNSHGIVNRISATESLSHCCQLRLRGVHALVSQSVNFSLEVNHRLDSNARLTVVTVHDVTQGLNGCSAGAKLVVGVLHLTHRLSDNSFYKHLRVFANLRPEP